MEAAIITQPGGWPHTLTLEMQLFLEQLGRLLSGLQLTLHRRKCSLLSRVLPGPRRRSVAAARPWTLYARSWTHGKIRNKICCLQSSASLMEPVLLRLEWKLGMPTLGTLGSTEGISLQKVEIRRYEWPGRFPANPQTVLVDATHELVRFNALTANINTRAHIQILCGLQT